MQHLHSAFNATLAFASEHLPTIKQGLNTHALPVLQRGYNVAEPYVSAWLPGWMPAQAMMSGLGGAAGGRAFSMLALRNLGGEGGGLVASTALAAAATYAINQDVSHLDAELTQAALVTFGLHILPEVATRVATNITTELVMQTGKTGIYLVVGTIALPFRLFSSVVWGTSKDKEIRAQAAKITKLREKKALLKAEVKKLQKKSEEQENKVKELQEKLKTQAPEVPKETKKE